MGGGYLQTLAVRLTAEIDDLRSKLSQGERLVQTFAAAASAAFLAIATAALAAGLQIDDALDGIRIGTGATQEALAGLEGSFNRVFANVPQSAGDVSTAITELSRRTGQTGTALEGLSTQVLTLARITKSDLNATVTDSAQLFNSWGIAASEQGNTLNMVLRTYQNTGVAVGALLQTMVTAGPVFRAAGFDFATSAALIGGFEKAGVNSQRAVASLTAAFRFFAKEGTDARTGVQQTIERIQALGPGAASAALGVKVFGRSAVDMVAAIQSGRLNVDALVASISTGTETINSAAKATDGFTETLAKLRNRAVQALEPFGTAILSHFNTALTGIIEPSRALLEVLNLTAHAAVLLGSVLLSKVVVGFAASAVAKGADFLATQAALRANVQYTAAVAAQAQAQFISATAALNAARAETALTGSVVAQRAALTAVATAHEQAAAATLAHEAAIKAASVSGRIATGVMAALKGAIGFLISPVGLVAIAVTALGWKFLEAGKKARQAAADMEEAAQRAQRALEAMSDTGVSEAFVMAVDTSSAWKQKVEEQQAITAALEARRKAGETIVRQEMRRRGGELDFVAVPTDFGRDLEQAQARLREYSRAYTEALATQERAGAESFRRIQQQATTPIASGALGPLDWEGAGASGEAAAAQQRAAQSLQERIGLLSEIAEIEQANGRTSVSIIGELNRLYGDAAEQLRAMGDAARLSPEALQDYRTLAKLIEDARTSSVVGPAAVRAVPVAAAPVRVVVSELLPSAERFARIAKASAADFGSTVTQKLAQGAEAFKSAMVGGATDAAERLTAASENVRGMWGSLLQGLPQQLRNFSDMFGALRETREAGGGGIAPFPGAVAFMLAAEAIAPVLEALREPFAALMVPIQMLAAAFGPLLGSVVKALFPIFKQFGIAVTYVAQVAGYVSGALLKVVGEIIRTVGSLIAKIPGLGEEGAAVKKFGTGLTDASKEMFEMAKAMPGVRDELRNLDWDEAMKRASESADRLADSLSNVPPIFDLIARQRQAIRGTVPSQSAVRMPDLTLQPAPSPASSQQNVTNSQQTEVHFHPGAFVITAGNPREMEEQLRRIIRNDLISELKMPGTSPLQRAVSVAVRNNNTVGAF